MVAFWLFLEDFDEGRSVGKLISCLLYKKHVSPIISALKFMQVQVRCDITLG